jgi:nucleotide-binding universal stress UspA family protein
VRTGFGMATTDQLVLRRPAILSRDPHPATQPRMAVETGAPVDDRGRPQQRLQLSDPRLVDGDVLAHGQHVVVIRRAAVGARVAKPSLELHAMPAPQRVDLAHHRVVVRIRQLWTGMEGRSSTLRRRVDRSVPRHATTVAEAPFDAHVAGTAFPPGPDPITVPRIAASRRSTRGMGTPSPAYGHSSPCPRPTGRPSMSGKEAMNMDRSIVCGLDGSQESRPVARLAAELADELHLELVLAHVVDDPPTFPYGDMRRRELQRHEGFRQGFAMLERLAAALPGEPPELCVLLGDVVESLRGMSTDEKTELLVVGSRGRGPLAATVLGSVSGALAGEADCPVMVVPSAAAADRLRARTTGSHVLCGVDESPGSLAAFAFAAELAEQLHLRLVPVHVAQDGSGEAPPPGTATAAFEVDVGDPVDRLLERASDEDAGVLVVGASSRRRWHGAELGPVARELAAGAPLPVVVVPPTLRSLEGLAAAMSRPGGAVRASSRKPAP